MLSILRIGDLATCGHAPIAGSPNVFANDIPVTRATVDVLNCPQNPPVVYAEGLNTVFVNNLPLVHIGDSNTHPGIAIEGSDDVFGDDMGSAPPAGVATLIALANFDTSYQIGVSRVEAAQHLADDVDVDGRHTGSDGSNRVIQRYVERAAGVPATTQTVVATAPPPTGTPAPTLPSNCSDIEDKPVDFDFYSPPFQLSPNFTLAQVSTNTLVSKYAVRAQGGLTVNQIVCNLRALCVNVLEPMKARYGNAMKINSGFRHGSGRSQHDKGQAVDVSFTDTPNTATSFARAQDVTNTFNYDQYIYEQNNSIWHHVSYVSSGGLRRQILTKPRGNKYLQGLHQVTI